MRGLDVGLDSWLTGLDLEDYAARLKQSGVTSLRALKAAAPEDLEETMAAVKMKKPHARVFRAAVEELVLAGSSQRTQTAETPGDPGAGSAAAARSQRLTSLGRQVDQQRTPAPGTPSFTDESLNLSAAPSQGFSPILDVEDSDSDDDRLPLVQHRPIPTPGGGGAAPAAGGDDQPATPTSPVKPQAQLLAPAPAPQPEPQPQPMGRMPSTSLAAAAGWASATNASSNTSLTQAAAASPPAPSTRPPSTGPEAGGVRAPSPANFVQPEPETDVRLKRTDNAAKKRASLGISMDKGLLMSMDKGWAVESGFLKFTGAGAERSIMNITAGTAVRAQQGAFLKISGDSSLSKPFNMLPTLRDRQRRVRQLTAILAVMETEWGLAMPPMIVSVTGNAAPFQMRPKFNAIFSQALLKATSATGAWVTTGGTDAGVMKLAGEAMKNSHTPVLGISAWGVVAGRGKLARPSQETIRARIADQIASRNDRAPAGDIKNIGTDDVVMHDYSRHKAKSWADPQSVPVDIGERVSFLPPFAGGSDSGLTNADTLTNLGLMSHESRPDITMKHPHLRTGKSGRGVLGHWGPNQALDTIVTRRIPNVCT